MSDPEIFSKMSGLLREGKAVVLATLINKEGSGPRY